MRINEPDDVAAYIEMLFEREQAIRQGHFIGTNGSHFTQYCAKERVLRNAESARILGCLLAEPFVSHNISVVVGGEVGGIGVALVTALALAARTQRTICWITARKDLDGNFFIREDDKAILCDQYCLVAEDIVFHGTNSVAMVRTIQDAGGVPVGEACIWNRSSKETEKIATLKSNLVTFSALVTRQLGEEWSDEESCALAGPCSRGVPVNTDFGHGASWLKRKQAKKNLDAGTALVERATQELLAEAGMRVGFENSTALVERAKQE